MGMRWPWELGSGSFGTVWRAKDIDTGDMFAVKRMTFEKRSEIRVTTRECEVTERLAQMPHPCIVKLLAVIPHQNQRPLACSLIMEYCASGGLDQYIGKRLEICGRLRPYSPPRLWQQWLAHLVIGLEYLHFKVRMLIRDIKPANVLISNDETCAKLCDFGMSKVNSDISSGFFSFGTNMPPGTPAYIAPEVLLGKEYDRRADYYSLGVLVWVLVSGGLLNRPGQPPCEEFTRVEEIYKLQENWKLLKKAIEDPEAEGARPVPFDELEIKDFILKLTNRKKDYEKVDRDFIHNHRLFENMFLPVDAANLDEVAGWLEQLRTETQ